MSVIYEPCSLESISSTAKVKQLSFFVYLSRFALILRIKIKATDK